jgi:hypothetical protein
MSASPSCAFEFSPDVPIDEIEATFRLALLATETLFGTDRVAIDAVYRIDLDKRAIDVDRSNNVGGTLALVFLGYLRREFGPEAYRMKRIYAPVASATGGAQ